MPNVCGTGQWGGNTPTLPSDPDNNSILMARPAFGGIDVSWSYPGVNPHAVAHTLLYRAQLTVGGAIPVFEQAVQIAVINSDFYYDRVAVDIQYYYWIRFVSINGTLLEPIGPATARARPLIEDMIELLTGQIDAGVLSQALRQEIDRITLNASALTQEIANRVAGNAELAAAVGQVQAGILNSLAFMQEEITRRQEGDSALIQQLNVLAALNQQNAALIAEERLVRVDQDGALASSIAQVSSAIGDNAAAIQAETIARTAQNNALAQQITTAQTSLGNNIASVQQTLSSEIDTVDGRVTQIGARYTATVDVNGLVGGFGVYNDGQVVEAGFNVDRFWIGRTAANRRKPFIVENDVVYINQAAINHLTFTKLRDEAGTFIVQNGRIQGAHLRVNSASIDAGAVGTLTIAGDSVVIGRQYQSASATVPASGSVMPLSQVINMGVDYNSGLIVTATTAAYSDGPATYQLEIWINGSMVSHCKQSIQAGYQESIAVTGYGANVGGMPTVQVVVRDISGNAGSLETTTMAIMGGKR